MTVQVFPSLPGIAQTLIRTPVWASLIQRTLSGKKTKIGYMSYPLYRWTIDHNALRSYGGVDELAQMIGFFNNCNGSAGEFLYMDQEDNTCLLQGFGSGDGTTKNFQLTRAYGGFSEPVQQPVIQTDGSDATFVVYDNGTPTTVTFSTGQPGVVSFATAPASGHALTWSGKFRFLCNFLDDTTDFTQEFARAWSNKSLAFESVKK